MKSLAESILSSTGSGKNRKIDVEYLLTHGFEPSGGSTKTIKHKETGSVLRIFGDKIVLNILKHYDDGIFIKRLVVSTIEDLELVIKWFKAMEYKDSTSEIEKLRKEIFKKLKEL